MEEATINHENPAMPKLAAYFFKPKGKSKYPARVYIFLQWEQWNRRNLFPMGLSKVEPFLTREMNNYEIEMVSSNHRLMYYQYENWEMLIQDEKEVLEVSDDSEHIKRLRVAEKEYPLMSAPAKRKKRKESTTAQIKLNF